MIKEKKGWYFRVLMLIVGLSLIMTLSFSMISAKVEVVKVEAISEYAIKDLNQPAVYNIELKNLGEADTFTLYSLIGVDFEPAESFFLEEGETKVLNLKAYSNMHFKVSPDYINFEYEIKGNKAGAQKETLGIIVVLLKDAFKFSTESINPESNTITLNMENLAGVDLNNVRVKASSPFFEETKELSFTSRETKVLTFAIDEQKANQLSAGQYIIDLTLTAENISAETGVVLKFEEHANLETLESKEGFLAVRTEIEKINKGNIELFASVSVTKDFFSGLFTSFNIPPTRTEGKGFSRVSIFEKNLAPGKSLKVVAITNWWIFIGIIVAIVLLLYFGNKYLKNKIVVTKSIIPVRTKGGEFALRVTIRVKARDFVEKIRIFDRIPHMLKLFEKYGLDGPHKIDESTRRLEWTIQALGKGEERTLGYIAYSKMGLVGKFELPQAEAIYEYEGKIKETSSNRTFYEKR